MKESTFVNDRGEIVARGRISPTLIDLILNDGTRYYSTSSVTLQIIKSLGIDKESK